MSARQLSYRNIRGGIVPPHICSLDDITVQEVPTDGTVALFPSADGSCI